MYTIMGNTFLLQHSLNIPVLLSSHSPVCHHVPTLGTALWDSSAWCIRCLTIHSSPLTARLATPAARDLCVPSSRWLTEAPAPALSDDSFRRTALHSSVVEETSHLLACTVFHYTREFKWWNLTQFVSNF